MWKYCTTVQNHSKLLSTPDCSLFSFEDIFGTSEIQQAIPSFPLFISEPFVILMVGPSIIILAAVQCMSMNKTGSSPPGSPGGTTCYNYFAFGSNMCSSTMTKLRSLNPVFSSAAVLPRHNLRFNIPGTSFIEPSWASVEPASDSEVPTKNVHGVLYKLTEEDFVKLCSSEGVPFAYTIHRCRVVPYSGNGKSAGADALESNILQGGQHRGSVFAYTLRAARPQWRQAKTDIPPSKSYLNVMIRGALEYQLDEEYVQELKSINPGRTVGTGFAETVLESAEQISKFKEIF